MSIVDKYKIVWVKQAIDDESNIHLYENQKDAIDDSKKVNYKCFIYSIPLILDRNKK